MNKSDLLLTKEEIEQAGQDYFENNVPVTHSQYTHNKASLKTAKAIREQVNYIDYFDNQLDDSEKGDSLYREYVQYAVSQLVRNLDSIIKEIEKGA